MMGEGLPHVCRIATTPVSAPRCFGSAAMTRIVWGLGRRLLELRLEQWLVGRPGGRQRANSGRGRNGPVLDRPL